MDNFFSGDEVLHYLGEGGWEGTMTCRHDRLPKSVPRNYFNFIKAAPVNARYKVAQFEQPIIAVKYVKHQDSDTVTDKKDFVLCHVSFQSTGGRGWLYGMEMDLYKSQFLDGCPGGYGTILYSFLYTWGSSGIPIFWT